MSRFVVLATLCCLSLAVEGGCGSNPPDAEPYDTYQDCFDDHHVTESLSVHDSIVVCCLDHPIAGVKPACGATAPDCETYLGTNLATTSATPAEVTMSCADYITEMGM